MDLSKFEKQILKTGFVLENLVAQKLKGAGWTVISNRYYVDDAEETVREIDLVAYKATKVQNVLIYTSLIISCKKNEENAWALLARPIDTKDPNSDWWPLHAWSNDPALSYELQQQGLARRYHDELNTAGVEEPLRLPEKEVFAFQMMNKTSGAPQNDKPIFDSVTSLMKAQSYEVSALPLRRKTSTPCLYQFNLLTIVDTELIRLELDGDSVTATTIDSEHYVARYIVREKETFSRIRFIKADHFYNCIAEYDRLHLANCQWFTDQLASFYADAIKHPGRVSVFLEQFRADLKWYLELQIKRNLDVDIDLKDLSIEWKETTKIPAITELFPEDVLKFLNSSSECLRRASLSLKRLYRYQGPMQFDLPDIPF